MNGTSPRSETMSQPDNTHYVRRLVLPSGRAIEVVYFDNRDAEHAAAKTPSTDRDLHICPECDSGMIYPVEWEEAGPTHWEVELYCPNCDWYDIGVWDQATVDRFDEELDRGTEHLSRDLKRLVQANMEDGIERFVKALESDAILPEDF
jgi:hypothetical protein